MEYYAIAHAHRRGAGSVRKPKASTEAIKGSKNWADGFAKVMEARRAGQEMREGKPHGLSLDRHFYHMDLPEDHLPHRVARAVRYAQVLIASETDDQCTHLHGYR